MLTRIRLHYELLQLTADASSADVRAAYLRRSLATHPDKGGCEEQFRQVRSVEQQAPRRRLLSPADPPSFSPCCRSKRPTRSCRARSDGASTISKPASASRSARRRPAVQTVLARPSSPRPPRRRRPSRSRRTRPLGRPTLAGRPSLASGPDRPRTTLASVRRSGRRSLLGRSRPPRLPSVCRLLPLLLPMRTPSRHRPSSSGSASARRAPPPPPLKLRRRRTSRNRPRSQKQNLRPPRSLHSPSPGREDALVVSRRNPVNSSPLSPGHYLVAGDWLPFGAFYSRRLVPSSSASSLGLGRNATRGVDASETRMGRRQRRQQPRFPARSQRRRILGS